MQAYLAAAPGWKQAVCRRIDALVIPALPDGRKAVKRNSPLHGIGEDGYFLAFHRVDRYVKVAFHKRARLEPPPPEASKQADVRYLHAHEGDELGDRFIAWVRQAIRFPGERI